MEPHEHLPLAPRDLLILSVLVTGPQHGYGILQSVEEGLDSGVGLDPANLYRVLRRMREQAWIEEVESESERRRVYRVTDTGRSILGAELTRLERLLEQARSALADVSPG